MKQNCFTGKTVAVTGKLDNYTRNSIRSKLLKLGAHPTASVSKKTDYLIVGARAGSKLDQARALGIAVLAEWEFEKLLG